MSPRFQASNHTITPSIASLAELEQKVDLIIVSQDKPDHCHKTTLCGWPKDKPVTVLAAPAAARKIRAWKHFDADRVFDMPSYTGEEESLIRVKTSSGLISIANLASKLDLTGLHNAVGISFKPYNLNTRSTTEQIKALLTPPQTPQSQKVLELPSVDVPRQSLRARVRSYSSLRSMRSQRPRTPIATPPRTEDDICISCIYSPHGVTISLIESYIKNHLEPIKALPLTVLLHGITVEQNPWYLGGIVASGAPAAIQIIKLLHGNVKYWIGAHDESKDNQGLSVKLLKTRRYHHEDVLELLRAEDCNNVIVRSLDCGESMVLR